MHCRPQNPKVTADRAFNGFGTNYEGNPEPIYGNLFLPRKFKIAVTGERMLPAPRCRMLQGHLLGASSLDHCSFHDVPAAAGLRGDSVSADATAP